MRAALFFVCAHVLWSATSSQEYESGSMVWPSIADERYKAARYSIVRGALEKKTARRIIELLENETFDEDLDSIDGKPTYEFYLFKNHNDESGVRTVNANKRDAYDDSFLHLALQFGNKFGRCLAQRLMP